MLDDAEEERTPGISHDLNSDSVALDIIEDQLGPAGPLVVYTASDRYHRAVF